MVAMILLSLFSFRAHSATPSLERGLLPLNLSDGLSDLLVNVIYRSSDGYMWFGTETGLDRFDGYKVKNFPINADDLRSKRVFSIAEGEKGVIFVGTNQGLYCVGPRKNDLLRILPEQLDFAVNSLVPGENGILYLGTRHGLYLYSQSDGKLQKYLPVNDTMSPENNIISLWLDSKGKTLWALSQHLLWKFSISDRRFTRFPLPADVDATTLTYDDGKVFVGTDGEGIFPFDVAQQKFLPKFSVGNGIISALSSFAAHRLLVGTDGTGVFIYDIHEGQITDHISASDDSKLKLRSNSVYSAIMDSEGLLWVGYYQSGVDYRPHINESLQLHFDEVYPEGIKQTIRSQEDTENYLAVGTHNGLLLRDKRTDNVTKYARPELDSDLVFTIKYWQGKFYIGTYHGGLYSLDPATGRLDKFASDLLNNKSIFKLELDPDGNMWVGASDGVYRFEKGSETPAARFTSANSQLPLGNVYEVYFDSRGRGWLCTENGMAIWDGQRVRTDGFPKGFIDRMKIRHILETSDHQLFFLPDRGDIWKSDLALSKFSSLDVARRHGFSAPLFIIEDNDGWLWIGTDNGLFCYDKKDSFLIANNLSGGQPVTYTHANPIKTGEGDLWFGTTTGLQHLDFAKLKQELKSNLNISLGITEIHTNGIDITDRIHEEDGKMNVVLKSDENDISFRLSDFSYNLPDYFELEVYCEDIDEDWRKVDGNESLHYYDLKPGRHRLHFRQPGRPDSEITVEINKKGGTNWILVIIIVVALLMAAATVFFMWIKEKHRAELALKNAGNFNENSDETTSIENTKSLDKTPYRTTRLSEEECKRLLKKLDGMMKLDKPYTNPNLKSKDLAAMIGSSPHALSFLFNQYLHKSYYDYVNQYRVDEFKRLVKDTDISKYTLSSLAERCGFSSRASFFRHFKAITGLTPSEYLKNRGID